MAANNINPETITKPLQLLAVWFIGLILIDTLFLTIATRIVKPEWASGTLVIASVVYVPLFVICLFLLQTRYRRELLADEGYTDIIKYIGTKAEDEIKVMHGHHKIKNNSSTQQVIKDTIKQRFTFLKQNGIQDPDLDLFIGVFNNNENEVKEALDKGANVATTDLALIEKYKKQLENYS